MRIDPAVRFSWDETPADPRLAAGDFTARWTGKLLAQTPGPHAFHLYAAGGALRLSIDGNELISARADKPQWFDSRAIELDYGHHAIELSFERQGRGAQLGLYWSGPRFGLERVPERLLFHDWQPAVSDRFADGRMLVRSLRCGSCHELPEPGLTLAAPSFARLEGTISRAWLMNWIGGPRVDNAKKQVPATKSETPPSPQAIDEVKFRMPGLGLSRDDARHIIAYLMSDWPGVLDQAEPAAVNEAIDETRRAGEELFHSLGCLACHGLNGLGSTRLLGGGDLSGVGEKRPTAFFARWLADPGAINHAHRMPVFSLSDEERDSLAAFLAAQQSPRKPGAEHEEATDDSPGGDPRRGRELVKRHNCAACHVQPSRWHVTPRPQPLRPLHLPAKDDWAGTCLGEPDVAIGRPGYRLREEQRVAVIEYLTAMPKRAEPAGKSSNKIASAAKSDGADVILARNCLSCHSRGLSTGIAEQVPAIVAAHQELDPVRPALAPPSLSDVGDKFERAAIQSAATTAAAPRRPWLKIRMPRFAFAPGEVDALADYLIAADRLPPREDTRAPDTTAAPSDDALLAAGGRLVTSEGFGCASCHQIGKSTPKQESLGAMGTDLSLSGERIRRQWFDRWVRNPARIVPRMEMPSIEQPVPGVLGDRLEDQLAAVWHVLNRPGFTPPAAGAIRVARTRNMPEEPEPAIVLAEVLRVGKRAFARPLVVGLSNRHTLLLDFERNRLTGWWVGDAARERTEGKRWFWEPGGTHLVDVGFGASELVLVHGGQMIEPDVVGQCAATLDGWEHRDGAVMARYRVQFTIPGRDAPVMVHVAQTISPLVGNGFRRRLEVSGLPAGSELRWRLFPEDATGSVVGDAFTVSGGPAGAVSARVGEPVGGHFAGTSVPVVVLKALAKEDKAASAEVIYTSATAADRFPQRPPAPATRTAARLDCVPGFDAVRLPLPASEMPTGLAWREDGTLLFTSLKGDVCAAIDSDGDGLPETLQTIAGELAAPYGIADHGSTIDVINKHGLLRLSDFAPDGRAQHIEVVADGWGHTDDYHDWAVGLVPDEAGGYYVALPCRQDKRSDAEARLRGTAVHLTPRSPTADVPRAFDVVPFCSGLRFPMGLARNRSGALFATDNQGHYNPFNELNHLEPDAHYGFFNKHEDRTGAPTRRDPAIEIPHPWTRSVNGICFLDTPAALRARTGKDIFGPWEGHLIGCEYDTRRLVRMTLERGVNSVYQGAVYPLSVEPDEGAETFEGPIVCQVGPDGALYVGNMRDSGWGAGQNTGSIVRLRATGELPSGIAEIRAAADGFEIHFTTPVNPQSAANAANYSISAFRRVPTSDYGGPDVDRHTVRVRDVKLSSDQRQVRLTLEELRPGFVYEFHLKNLATGDEMFHPAEAYYTLRERVGSGQ